MLTQAADQSDKRPGHTRTHAYKMHRFPCT